MPTKLDFHLNSEVPTWKVASEKLGLRIKDIEINKNMGRKFLTRLNSNGVRGIDLFSKMQEAKEALYWEKGPNLSQMGRFHVEHKP